MRKIFIGIREKTKTRVGLKLLTLAISIFSISFASFFVASALGLNNETNQLSLITPNKGTAKTEYLSRGALVAVSKGQTVQFARSGGGYFQVRFIESVAVDPANNACLQANSVRAHVEYKEYDAGNKLLDTQDLTIGPCDTGWAVEVIKSVDPGADRAVITVPEKGK